jgi:protein TonB
MLLLALTLAATNGSPSCAAPNVAASTVIAAMPNKPVIAENNGLTGTTFVQIDLDENGNVNGTSIAKSSGYSTLDQAALAAARESTFRPGYQDCQPLPGSYLFEVDFPE